MRPCQRQGLALTWWHDVLLDCGQTVVKRPSAVAVASSLLVALPLLVLAMTAILIWVNEADSEKLTQARLAGAVQTVASEMGALVRRDLAALAKVDEDLGPSPQTFASRRAPARPETTPAVLIVSATGHLLPGNVPGLKSVDLSQNVFFQSLAKGAPWAISPFFLQEQTSAKTFALGRRLERDGRFAGVALMFIPADVLSATWSATDLGVDSTLGVYRLDGWMVTRYPVPDAPLDFSKSELFTKHLPTGASGLYNSNAFPAEQSNRLERYQRIDGLPLVAVVSISQEALSASFWQRVRSTALVTAPLALALFGVCLWVVAVLRHEQKVKSKLEASLEQNTTLLQESHHRIKNNLQTVAAMVALQQIPQQVKEDLTRRVAAMAALHQRMYERNSFETLDVADYLHSLAASLRAGNHDRIALVISVEPLTLPADRALSLGLIINEIVSNAYKHAFPGGRCGTIEISLVKDGDTACLHVSDDGVGYPVDSKCGMGTRLIKALSTQLGGVGQRREGRETVFELKFAT